MSYDIPALCVSRGGTPWWGSRTSSWTSARSRGSKNVVSMLDSVKGYLILRLELSCVFNHMNYMIMDQFSCVQQGF